MAIAPNEPHALYRFFGAGGTLLYIGITNSIPTRLKRHNQEKAWWLGVSHVTVEHYPNRAAVLEAERRAIRTERPLYNEVHNEAGRNWGGSEGSDRGRLLAICMACEEPISPGMGALHVREQQALEVLQYQQERRPQGLAVITLEELLRGPEDARWLVHCDWCNPHRFPDDDDELCPGCYAIDVGQCSTWAQLVDWTAHLMEKPWVAVGTNWLDFIRAVASPSTRTGIVDAANERLAV